MNATITETVTAECAHCGKKRDDITLTRRGEQNIYQCPDHNVIQTIHAE